MLATNFYEKRDMEFSIEKNISENSELKETTVIKIQKNEYVFDKSSEIKTLIYILDILKKNKIKNVTFANDPSEKK